MKIKSRVNGLIVEATNATAEVLKLGNGKYAQVISDNDAQAPATIEETPDPDAPIADAPTKKTTTRKTTTKKTTAKSKVDAVKAEAKAKGINLTDAQIEGGNEHDDTTEDDGVEQL